MMMLSVCDFYKSMCIVAFGDGGVAAMYKKTCKKYTEMLKKWMALYEFAGKYVYSVI